MSKWSKSIRIGTYVTINSIQLDTSDTHFQTKYISSDSLQSITTLTSNKILQTYKVNK